MKMTTEHYAELKARIDGIGAGRIAAHRQAVIAEGKAKDVELRVRWDALYALRYHDGVSALYKYLDDTNIDTALRSIFRELDLNDEPDTQRCG